MIRAALRAARAGATSRDRGQIMILFAVFMVVLLVLAGSAYDYASIVVDDAKLQNAVDAAALAGSDSLIQNASSSNAVAVASATASYYLSQNGVVADSRTTISMSFPTATPVPGVPTPSVPINDDISLSVTRSHPTAFWPLVGVNTVTMSDGSGAHSGRGMIDVMLSLDMTYSQVQSGSITDIENAAAVFIKAMHPTVGDPRGARIALARFGGLVTPCTYDRYGNLQDCTPDYTLLSDLSDDQSKLLEIADGKNEASCPSSPVDDAPYACPLRYNTTYGTRLQNSIEVVGTATSSVFSGANGRNNPTTGIAHKVLIIMTDGENVDATGLGRESQWNTDFASLANALKPGASSSPADDIEIYTINFTCPNGTMYGDSSGNCGSELAYNNGRGAPYACPSATKPADTSMSQVDQILLAVSSSTPGSCDHYFPLRKGDPLPDLFLKLAGSISRGQLTR